MKLRNYRKQRIQVYLIKYTSWTVKSLIYILVTILIQFYTNLSVNLDLLTKYVFYVQKNKKIFICIKNFYLTYKYCRNNSVLSVLYFKWDNSIY